MFMVYSSIGKNGSDCIFPAEEILGDEARDDERDEC